MFCVSGNKNYCFQNFGYTVFLVSKKLKSLNIFLETNIFTIFRLTARPDTRAPNF